MHPERIDQAKVIVIGQVQVTVFVLVARVHLAGGIGTSGAAVVLVQAKETASAQESRTYPRGVSSSQPAVRPQYHS